MNIRTKLRISVGVALVLVVALAGGVQRLSVRVMEGIDDLSRTDQIVRAVLEIHIVTGDYMQHWLPRAEAQWRSKHGSLAALLSAASLSDPQADVLVRRMRGAHDTLGALFEEVCRSTHAEAAGAPSTGLRERLRAQMDVNLLTQIAAAHRLFDTIHARLRDVQRQSDMLVLVFSVAVVVLVGATSVAVHRSAIRPLGLLHHATTVIGSGDLRFRTGAHREDEIGNVLRAFDTMTERLQQTTASRDELAREVTQRRRAQAELATAMRRLRNSNRELEQFAYVASHDLQEPLRKTASFSNLLVEELGDGLSTDARFYLERMLSAVKRMQRLIADMLSLSRVATRAKPFERVALDAVLAEVVSDLEPRLADTGGTVEVAPLPEIEGDPGQLHQVFQNLVGNGLKFHRPDVPPVVRVCTRDGAPDGAAPQPGETYCHIEVRDNGIGFDAKYCERIFGIFQRLHSRTAYEGSGIGLAITRRIVDRHRGTIVACGEPGAGAAFVVSLPIRQPMVADNEEEEANDGSAVSATGQDPDGGGRP